jgi:hypothetical protein
MTIKVKIAPTQAISSSLSEVNRIRLSSPEIDIKPSVSLEELDDVTIVGAEDGDILSFSSALRKYAPSEQPDFTLQKVFGGQF